MPNVFNTNASVALKTLERHVLTPHVSEVMEINSIFLDPPTAVDAFAAFNVEQTTTVFDGAPFNDTSNYTLNMYQLVENGFDGFLVQRSLKVPSEQFLSSSQTTLIFQPDSSKKVTFSLQILSVVMNSREQHERLVREFKSFLVFDQKSLFNESLLAN